MNLKEENCAFQDTTRELYSSIFSFLHQPDTDPQSHQRVVTKIGNSHYFMINVTPIELRRIKEGSPHYPQPRKDNKKKAQSSHLIVEVRPIDAKLHSPLNITFYDPASISTWYGIPEQSLAPTGVRGIISLIEGIPVVIVNARILCAAIQEKRVAACPTDILTRIATPKEYVPKEIPLFPGVPLDGYVDDRRPALPPR